MTPSAGNRGRREPGYPGRRNQPGAGRARCRERGVGAAAYGSSDWQAEIEAMVDSLEVIGRQVHHASPERLSESYEQVGMEMVYNAQERTVDVTVRPHRRVNAGVRGGLVR
jgi:hypothetical protein